MPLQINEMTDDELVLLVKNEANSDALIEIKKRHEALCHDIYNRFYKAVLNARKSFEDLISDKDYLIWTTCLKFDSTKGAKFSTYLGNQVTYACLNYITKNPNRCFSIEEEEMQPVINSLTGVVPESKDTQNYCMHILNGLSDNRIKTIYEKRYISGDNPSWSQIAQDLNLSTQTILNLHSKGMEFLKKKLTSDVLLDTI